MHKYVVLSITFFLSIHISKAEIVLKEKHETLANIYSDSILNDIIKTVNYRDGIYKDYKEFRNNSPSIKNLKIKAVERDLKYNFFRFIFIDSLNKETLFEDEIWGFCVDGTMFLNAKKIKSDKKIRSNSIFTPLAAIGRYCYFSDIYNKNSSFNKPEKLFSELKQSISSRPLWKSGKKNQYVLNINNGEVFILNKRMITTIFKSDIEFYSIIRKRVLKEERYYYFNMIKFNERNKGQIRPIL